MYLKAPHYKPDNLKNGSEQGTVLCGPTSLPLCVKGISLPSSFEILNEVLPITQEEAVFLEQKTVRQADSQIWKEERKMRITASNFGLILRRKKPVNDTFLNFLFNQKEFSTEATH